MQDTTTYSTQHENINGSDRRITARGPANLNIGAPMNGQRGGARNIVTTTDAADNVALFDQTDGVVRTNGGNDVVTVVNNKNMTIDAGYTVPPRTTGLFGLYTEQPKPPSDNDTLRIFDSFAMQIYTGIGDDNVELSHSTGSIHTGEGNDTIRMNNLEFNSRLIVDGGEGQDTFIASSPIIGKSVGRNGVTYLAMRDGSQVELRSIERIEDANGQVSLQSVPNVTPPAGGVRI